MQEILNGFLQQDVLGLVGLYLGYIGVIIGLYWRY